MWAGWFLNANLASGQGTAFTYQGRLIFNGSSASGNVDLTFGLFDDPVAGNQIGSTITNLDLSVSNGLVTVVLDFGTSAFPGADRWLQIGVRTNGSAAAFTTLSPRQKLTPAPYSMTAANFTGAIADSQLSPNVALLNGANVFTGPISSIVAGTTNYLMPSGVVCLLVGQPRQHPGRLGAVRRQQRHAGSERPLCGRRRGQLQRWRDRRGGQPYAQSSPWAATPPIAPAPTPTR